MPAPFSYYVMGNVYAFCPACKRQFRYRLTQFTSRIKCPYPDCRRRFHVHITLTPVTSVPYKQPTPEQVEQPAEPLAEEKNWM